MGPFDTYRERKSQELSRIITNFCLFVPIHACIRRTLITNSRLILNFLAVFPKYIIAHRSDFNILLHIVVTSSRIVAIQAESSRIP